MKRSSRISGFYKLPPEEQIRKIKEFAGLSEEDLKLFNQFGYLSGTPYFEKRLGIKGENIIGPYIDIYRIVPNFRINGKDYMIPMVIEEDTIVAAASNIARLCRDNEGILAKYTESIMIGHASLYNIDNFEEAKRNILENKESILQIAQEVSKNLQVRDINVYRQEEFLITELFVNARDAMGARRITEMCEAMGPRLEEITKGTFLMGIISNLDVGRIVDVELKVRKESLGEEVVKRILKAYHLSEIDEKEAVTRNKGLMNGIIAVARATGQDERALNEAVYSYVYRNGIRQLSQWYEEGEYLVGKLKIPMHVGTVGGATNHPMAQLSLKIMGIAETSELAEVTASAGLVQNLGALRSLVTEGITEAHRRLEK
jgi:hydroxymethylglutaryl-CoA reductase